MLVKYDEMIAMVEKAAPLNRLYDDVAHLRIVRCKESSVTRMSPSRAETTRASSRPDPASFADDVVREHLGV